MKFKNYVNKHAGDNRIYSFNDITQMALGDVLKNKEELLSQYRELGVPSDAELQSSENVVYVHAYTRDDGTEVKAHYRSKPNFELGVEKNVYAEPQIQAKQTQPILPQLQQTTSMPSVVQKQNIPNPNINGINQDELSGILERMLKLPYLNNANINQELGKNEQNRERMDLLQGLWNDYKGIQDPTTAIMYALGAFISNYKNMKDANTIGADKYFHAKANYEAAQQGIAGSTVAKIISDLRELTDSYRNIHEKGYTPEFSKQDSEEDQNANIEGRNLGFKYSTKPASLMLKHLIPKGLPKRYRKY